MAQSGLAGAESALQGGLAGALAGLTEGVNTGRADLQPFASSGGEANALQAALSGASGAPAQQQAFDNFSSSPGQQFLRDQAEKALIRNSAATGGLGGGNVLQALQQQAVGLASQDFQNQFNRLGDVANRGFNAATGQAQIASAGGQQAANLASNTGQSLAGVRTRAGENIANAVGGTSSALSQLINQQGQGLSNILGGAAGNISNILSGAGQAQALSQTQLATLLANIATQQGSQAASLPGVPGVQNSQGSIGGIGQAASGIGSLISLFSDIRMKENLHLLGQTEGGNNVYSWEWKPEIKHIVGNQMAVGVIAQEINQNAVNVHESGYLVVDYSKVN